MIRQVLSRKGSSASLTTLLRSMHIGSEKFVGGGIEGTSQISGSLLFSQPPVTMRRSALNTESSSFTPVSRLAQARQGSLEMPMQFIIRPSIGIPPEMLWRPEYGVPVSPKNTPVEIPTVGGNLNKEIRDSPNGPAQIEKQAARLIVIRRSKMNKHKLRKLRKKMKYAWAKVRLRRAIRKEKAYLNSKMDLIRAARSFNAKEYVAGIIKRAKEEPIPYKWSDPLMPEWYKEQEMKKEAWQKRYQKMINLYVNKSITIDFTEKKK